MRKEIHLTPVEKNELELGAKLRGEKHMATHLKKCALKQNDEYIKYQFNDKPAPLNRVFASKEDLV